MTIGEHIETFAGLPVAAFDPEQTTKVDGAHAWRLAVDWEAEPEDIPNLFAKLRATAGVETVRALILGEWGESQENLPPYDQIIAAAEWLPNLTALFLAELTYTECEISWISQDDITPVLRAYPRLEVLRVRGAKGMEGTLSLEALRHESLREFALESGGLPTEVVRAVGACDFPALEHLELWLGTEQYGGTATVDDLAPILSAARLPQVTTLGLRDAEIADQVAEVLAGAPVVAQLHTLDLSLGMLSDQGAEALLAGQPLTHLKRLDVHHHYLSDAMAARLVAELPAVDVDVSDQKQDDKYGRFVAVGE